MNRTRKTNASGGPKTKYNEYTDFHQCEVEGHICAAFLEMSGMAKANGMHNWHLLSDILHSICKDSDHRRNSFFSRYIHLQLPTGFF